MKKVILVILTGMISVILIVILLFIIAIKSFGGSDGVLPPNQRKMERIFSENQDELTYLSVWLYNMEYKEIRIDIFDSVERLRYYKENDKGGIDHFDVNITDQEVLDNLYSLREENFIRILKENGYVYFQKWGSFVGGCGMLYNPYGMPDIDTRYSHNVNEVYKMKADDWYYYNYTED